MPVTFVQLSDCYVCKHAQRVVLSCRKLNVDEAAEKLARMMQWRKDFLRGVTPSAADVAAEAATGKAYLHSHKDVNGRPVIVIRASRHITGQALLIALDALHPVHVCLMVMQHQHLKHVEGLVTILGLSAA